MHSIIRTKPTKYQNFVQTLVTGTIFKTLRRRLHPYSRSLASLGPSSFNKLNTTQTPEALSFLNRIASLPKGPGVSLDQALQPSLDDEAVLRRLFATDKTNARLGNPHIGLVDVFNAPADIRTTRARVVSGDDDLIAKYVMPLSDTNRRKEGAPAMVTDLEEFKKNWSIFTENSLSQLFDWNNVVAAGGAVLACLSPLPDHAKVSKRAMRKYYHSTAYPTSDVDLFLWGLTPEQAEAKINDIYEAVRDSVPWDVTCVRTKHTLSIHSQYPYRSVQIVLRLYNSPAEILAGFDIDAPCCAYDNQRVWANPRAIVAMMRQCNTVDMTRRSPSYEVRLAKYHSRAFEVYVPTLKRADIDPTIYERSIARIEGLARLLVLEKLITTDLRNSFLDARRTLRGRPNPLSRYARRRRRHKGDLKADTSIGGLEMNDYDVASLHIPYGPGWDARRIDKLVYQTDLGMNSTFNPQNKDRRLHRHPAFFGTMVECLEDCCGHCPKPIDDDEKKLQEEEDNLYIRDRISFIEEDPGRQSISGSFNPIDVGEWSGQAYIGQTEKFFTAIAAQDRAAVSAMIKAGSDLDRRDHVGRTPLHVAIFSKSTDIACDLIDAGARMTARLVDGRTSLHLATQFDQIVVVRKLLERSVINAEEVNLKAQKDEEDGDQVIGGLEVDSEHPSSEADWAPEEHDNADERPKRPAAVLTDEGDIPEDEADLPDVLDVNLPDWDFAFTPLSYAVLFASLPMIETLLTAGADPKLTTRVNGSRASASHPLTLTTMRDDGDHTSKIAERLLLAGATSSTADEDMYTVFHRAVSANQVKLVSTFLRLDPNASTVLDFPYLAWRPVTFPVVTALAKGNYSMLAIMLAHGAKYVFTEEDVMRARAASPKHRTSYVSSVLDTVHMPAEVVIARHDDIVQLLIALGAQLNFKLGTQSALYFRAFTEYRKSLLDWVRFAIQRISERIETKEKEKENAVKVESKPSNALGWKGYHDKLWDAIQDKQVNQASLEKGDPLHNLVEIKEYLTEIERLLVAHGANTWNEIYPDEPSPNISKKKSGMSNPSEGQLKYLRYTSSYGRDYVPHHETPLYDELYEACFAGDNAKIQQMCLPPHGFKGHSEPLQISVQTAVPTNQHNSTGYTPLFAALSGRQWKTARLVLTIASAQYHPDAKEEKFSTVGVSLDMDSDEDSDDLDASDEMVDRQEVNLIDIAKRPSVIHCDVHPKRMLHEATFNWPREPETVMQHGNLLLKSVDDNDFEAFINIANLYKTIPDPISLGTDVLERIVNLDRPDMLDEYIRRTGIGIDITVSQKDGQEEIPISTDKNRVYLGLSVHGKKRMDLAKKNDPNARHEDQGTFPLLWKAALAAAHDIVDYLSGDRPLAAYHFYSASNTDERATHLRRTPNLDQVLPEWLGWTISPLGESPLTAAILGNNFDLLKKLFQKSPRLMTTALHERIKFLGYNPLMLAIDKGCDPAVVDYLLAKSVSPAETDQVRGWNIFHIMCSHGHHDLLQHLLRKLPKDVVTTLLSQQSKGRLNTPLHIAVRTSNTRSVKLIVDYSKANLLTRNVDGSTPLHSAVQQGYSEITKLLIDASPAEALCTENGVGETPLETATQQELVWRTHVHFISPMEEPRSLSIYDVPTNPKRFDLGTKEHEISRFRSTLDELLHDGGLKRHTKLANELLTFADKMEERLAATKAAPPEVVVVAEDENKNKKDVCNRKETLKHVEDAISARTSLRRLVHLIDVQKSVQGNLPRYGSIPQKEPHHRDEDGLQPEEDGQQKKYRGSLVYANVGVGVDHW